MILHKDNFQNYAVNHLGMSSNTLNSYEKQLENTVQNMHTPSIIEERNMNMSIISVFDRLIYDRIIYLTGGVDSRMANIFSAQLLYLNSLETSKPVTLYINSGGGEVYSGLSIVDSIGLSNIQLDTVCFGMAASMASVILGAGKERSCTRFSKVMLHQSSGGVGGNIIDSSVAFQEWTDLNNTLFELLGEYTNKTAEQVKLDASRDLWLTSTKALEYGIVDKIYWDKNKIITLDNLHEVKK